MPRLKRKGRAARARHDYAEQKARPMKQYKGHPVYGVAVPAERCWNARGLIFDRDLTQTIEIKRIECATDLTFKHKREAEEFALKLCREWIDEQTAD
jgi:hypothetical protein